MKHIFTILFLFCNFNFSFADNIEIKEDKSNATPRSIVLKPKVQLDTNLGQLTISFSSQDSYTLYLENFNGVIVHLESLITDGSKYTYNLTQFDESYYTIRIASDKRSFIGEFYL